MCSFTIGSDGSLVATVGARQAVAVHVGALGTGTGVPQVASQVPVLFYETATTTLGEVGDPSFFLPSVRPSVTSSSLAQQNIFVVGSVPQLGNWDPSNAVRSPLRHNLYADWFWSLMTLRLRRYRLIRPATPSGLRRCTCLQIPCSSISSYA